MNIQLFIKTLFADSQRLAEPHLSNLRGLIPPGTGEALWSPYHIGFFKPQSLQLPSIATPDHIIGLEGLITVLDGSHIQQGAGVSKCGSLSVFESHTHLSETLFFQKNVKKFN